MCARRSRSAASPTDDIKEIILQQASYCGVPAGNHAFREAEAVLKEIGQVP